MANLSPPQPQPSRFQEAVAPALRHGAWAGVSGVLVGIPFAILRDSPPVFFAGFTGLQWFTLASTFSLTRQLSLPSGRGGPQNATNAEKIKASAIAGGVAGATGGLIRGPRNILYGSFFFSLFSSSSQFLLNEFQSSRDARIQDLAPETLASIDTPKGWWQRMLESQWSPLQKIPDEDYEKLIKERILGIEADMALIDEKIRKLRGESSK